MSFEQSWKTNKVPILILPFGLTLTPSEIILGKILLRWASCFRSRFRHVIMTITLNSGFLWPVGGYGKILMLCFITLWREQFLSTFPYVSFKSPDALTGHERPKHTWMQSEGMHGSLNYKTRLNWNQSGDAMNQVGISLERVSTARTIKEEKQ